MTETDKVKAELERIRADALAEAPNLASRDDIDRWRIRYIGRKGLLTQVLRALKDLPAEERGPIGEQANRIKAELSAALQEGTRAQGAADAAALDMAKPGIAPPGDAKGGAHISSITMDSITAIFAELGFQAIEGPEVELEKYNFDLLNIPPDHPARDLMDTIWLDSAEPGGLLLRTHTSPMQIRAMERLKPPIRVVVPGKCYRHEATDMSHEWQFHQIEGLAIGRGITFANMKWVFEQFAQRMFGANRRVRLRCDFFPFVEPGVDVSVDCFICSGGGCRLCRHSGWIEIMGAGMVHPNVLRGVGYDPAEYSGFAFGMGPERIAMLLHGIDDIRKFFQNDLRFLEQFG